MLHGRYYVACEDVRAVAPAVLRHRIITNFNAEAEGVKPDEIVTPGIYIKRVVKGEKYARRIERRTVRSA